MRILHIDPDDMDNPLSGGGPVRTFEICRRLARRHQVTVLTPTFPGSTPEKYRDGIRYLRVGRKVGDHGSSHHITFLLSLPGAIRRHRYDLLVEDLMPPASATFTPMVNRKPMVGSAQWFFARELASRYHLPFHLGERYGMRLYPNLVVLTDAMRRRIRRYHPKCRTVVIPNGVDRALFEMPPRYGGFALYLGRVDCGQKGVDLLLSAYATVPPSERLPLVVAGHGFEGARVEAMIGSLGLRSHVHLVGRVDGAAKRGLLRDCRFVCVPSRDETFGMVIAEACAAGKQVVVFDRAPMNEVAAPEGCVFVPPWDVAAYGEAIADRTRASEAEMAGAGERCRRWARRFDWDRVAETQEDFYQKVVEGTG